jgi:hypothetical protein
LSTVPTLALAFIRRRGVRLLVIAIDDVVHVDPNGSLEEHFFSSLIKADGNFLVFFERPIAGTLGALCLLIWLWPLARRLRASAAR